jgi:FlaA1/EpsC-like NDP-sugar epimerase
LVLDMGTPVRIAEVAERLAAQSEPPVRVIFTGMRKGEKMHEALLGAREVDERPIHHAISQVQVPPLDPLEVRALDPWATADEVIGAMSSLCLSEPVSSPQTT